MIEFLTVWTVNKALAWAGGSIILFVATWFLKWVPTAKIRKVIYDVCFEFGAMLSRFFNNWKYTKAIWENTLEPWLLGFLDMVFGAIFDGLSAGMRSDN